MKFFSKFKKVNVFLILFAFIGTIFLSSFNKLVLADENEYVLTNVLNGLIPTTNSKHMIISGDSTVPQVSILHPDSATDGDNSYSNDDSLNTKVIVGEETGGLDNGYSKWEPVFLQYDFKKIRPVKEIKIYRNTYDNAISTFKDVKVELSTSPNFEKDNTSVVFEKQDIIESRESKGNPQIISLDKAIDAQYIRIWGKGHYIENTNSSWKGYSNGNLYNEIEVMANVPKSEVPSQPDNIQPRNLASGKLPYVYGLEPSNIEAITDGKIDDNYAVHNSMGNNWLQFEYKNTYKFNSIKFKLEPGNYKSVKVAISNSPNNGFKEVFSKINWTQNNDLEVINLPSNTKGRYIRFTIDKDGKSKTKYSEIEIWGTGNNYDESKDEYVEPQSKYNELVWSDEFNGEKIDENKWTIIDGMVNHGAIYNRGAVSIKKDGNNSYLAINTKNFNSTEELIKAVGVDNYLGQSINKQKVTWSSGRIESKNKYSFQFGRMAVRAKVNDSQGIWPAIWMLSQDETGHDEIDVLEYLGQDPWGAWTTNHFGILGKNKASNGIRNSNYEAWSQDFHVFEVEWDPEFIKWYIDGKQVFQSTQGRDDGRDGMHTRPMFPILETQVGDGWVGDVDYNKQNTKQNSDYLIDWIRIYQMPNQSNVKFDDLISLDKKENKGYEVSPYSHTNNLIKLSDGDLNEENKDNFYYGGQPRLENSRIAVGENADRESIIYNVPNVKDVHLTTYYQTIEDKMTWNRSAGAYEGYSIRSSLISGNIDFKLFTSEDGEIWDEVRNVKIVDNFVEKHPGYARTTFDAYDLPNNTRFIKIEFPQYKNVKYRLNSGAIKDVKNTDIQLAKVTFLQNK
ncbi:family 16 glycosylhydrolase [Clostridium perfringens]|uniref:family 16 glycosylhydrolase n=1 Tax=Clostridium perfringens TaxID=1502 RepID=UPI0028E1572D|nr:family 16 glycosylhydrolase [Clostridium perfringens]MDT9336839.1 family 16 glycosylhydrolase [Clostridium perfringens]MDT9344595.1 family 16 glycosylhydrolase [Clostridium perfringens]MDT9347838.1 family 16 glycosylhydrolase [Clostridium perfringens]MDT9353698.1 family 16 glycosylhydrolase [Clostridium perfringens]